MGRKRLVTAGCPIDKGCPPTTLRLYRHGSVWNIEYITSQCTHFRGCAEDGKLLFRGPMRRVDGEILEEQNV